MSTGPHAGTQGEPDPADGIPAVPRADYRYYVRATTVSDSAGPQKSLTMTFEMFRDLTVEVRALR